MAVSYKKLIHLMIEKDITAPQLQKQAGFSGNIFTRMRRNIYVSLESIETICRVLDCNVDDFLEFVPDGVQTGGKYNG
jgi:DNA-binding Xre family transcriptional regulator